MNLTLGWLAALLTVAVLLSYEASLAVAHHRRPARMARTAHANLRKDWFEAVSAQKGSEILAVQTLRNALMSASITTSTAALGLMGIATLAAPSLHAELSNTAAAFALFTPLLAMELVLLALLFASMDAWSWPCATTTTPASSVASPSNQTPGDTGPLPARLRCAKQACFTAGVFVS